MKPFGKMTGIPAGVLVIITCLLIVCGCLSASPQGSTQAATTAPAADAGIRLITEDLPPFSYAGAGGVVTGQSADVVNGVLSRMNQKADIVILPWEEGYQAALAGPKVALFSTARTAEREHLFRWAGPIASFDYMLYAKNGSSVRVSSLEGAKKAGSIGVVKDDARHQFLQQNNFSGIVTCDSDAACMRSLLAGTTDLWLGSTANAAATAREEGIDPVSFTAIYPVRTVDLYIAFSNDTPDSVVVAWQDALDGMKRDGTFDAIRKRYGTDGSVVTDATAAAGTGAAEMALSAMVARTDGRLKTVLVTYKALSLTADAKSKDWQKIRPLLSAVEENEEDVIGWYANPDGSYYIVADGLTTANLQSRSYFPVVLAGSDSVGTVVVSKSTGRNAAVVAVPVKDGNTVTGVLGASVYLDTLADTLRIDIPAPYVFYAIDRDGMFALHSDKGRISQDTATITAGSSYGDAIRQIRAQDSGSAAYDDGGIRYRAVFRSSPLTGWRFVVAWPDTGS
jgi:hypothetical protein